MGQIYKISTYLGILEPLDLFFEIFRKFKILLFKCPPGYSPSRDKESCVNGLLLLEPLQSPPQVQQQQQQQSRDKKHDQGQQQKVLNQWK